MTEISFPARITSFEELSINQRFLLAAFRGITPIVNEILSMPNSEGFEPNCYDKEGFTALHAAASRGFADMVQMLIDDPRIDKHALDKFGRHAIQLAWTNRNERIVKMLFATLPGNIGTEAPDEKFINMLFSAKDDVLGDCLDISEIRNMRPKRNKKLEYSALTLANKSL